MHQIYLFQSTSHLGMKGPQSEFPMKVLMDALKRGMSMAILHGVCLLVTFYQFENFMKVFRELLGGRLTAPTKVYLWVWTLIEGFPLTKEQWQKKYDEWQMLNNHKCLESHSQGHRPLLASLGTPIPVAYTQTPLKTRG